MYQEVSYEVFVQDCTSRESLMSNIRRLFKPMESSWSRISDKKIKEKIMHMFNAWKYASHNEEFPVNVILLWYINEDKHNIIVVEFTILWK